MNRIVLVIGASLSAVVLLAQKHQQLPSLDSAATEKDAHASTLLQAFQWGHFQGNFRTFLMVTDNERQLSDYYAWAAGGSLHYSSAPWHGFQTGFGGMFNYNLMSSNLAAIDSLTGAKNRYEIGLFDVEDPSNRKDLDRLEALWLRYNWRKSKITAGHQSVQTPFVNDQDGRMRPTVESGIWAEYNEFKNTKIEGGWLWKISPRSTVRWFGIGESIGLYPKGLNPDGTTSGYPEHLKSDGIGLLGFTRQVGKNTKIQLWDQWVDHIYNTAFAQADYQLPLKNGHKLVFGFQYIHQNALADGGNADATKTYFLKGGYSNAVSLQTGWEDAGWQALVAYTRVTGEGRFLTPREWGREPFYTFMSRERIEGSGDSHSITGRLRWRNKHLRLEAAYGRFYLPDVKNAALNKYAFPAFNQFNLDVRYTFSGVLDGFRMQLLYVRKGRLGDVYGNEKYVINKVGISHFNCVLNYTF